MDFDLVIKGGEVVDPGSGLLGRMDVGIRDGVIAAVDRSLPAAGAGATLDADGADRDARPVRPAHARLLGRDLLGDRAGPRRRAHGGHHVARRRDGGQL